MKASNQRQASAGFEDLNTSAGSTGSSSRQSRKGRKSNRNQRGRGRNTTNDSVATNDTNESGAFKLFMSKSNENDSSLQSALSMASSKTPVMSGVERPILPQQQASWDAEESDDDDDNDPRTKKSDWLVRMNRRLNEIPVGDLDPQVIPLSAIMNAWAKTKSSQGATMVEMWLNRAQQEYEVGNGRVVPTTKMYTMAGKNLAAMIG